MKRSGFTLIELSIVLLALSVIAVASLRYAAAAPTTNNINQLNKNLDIIDNALLNYRIIYGRLPCPADITKKENDSSFGAEIEVLADGLCTGANYFNTNPDPDIADGLYDATTLTKVAGGGIPTRALMLPDRYAYDPWGKKILYAVDIRMTANGGFALYNINNAATGAIVIKKTAGDTLANALTYKGVYALVSFGKNGHGGFLRNLNAAATVYNAGSTNSDEQKNCHCDNTAAATNFDRIFVQKPPVGSTTLTDKFDDIVRFKIRSQMLSPLENQ